MGVSLVLPSSGDKVLLDGAEAGTVERVLPAGKFPLVIYRDKQGNEQRKRLADLTIQTESGDG